MKILYFLFTILVISSFLSCKSDSSSQTADQSPSPTEEKVEHLGFPEMAAKLLEQADLQLGETVLLVGKSGRFDPLIPLLEKGIKAKKAVYLGAIDVGGNPPESWETAFTKHTLGLSSPKMVEEFLSVKLGIMLPGATPHDPPYKAMQDVLGNQRGRTIHFHWAGAYDLNGNEININEEIDAFYQKVLLNTDYQALAQAQSNFEAAMRGNTIRVTTPSGTDISFNIGDRPVTKQDGDASFERTQSARNLIDREIELPAGAIRVAPVETTVNGTIVFPPSEWNGQAVSGLKMNFKEGKLTDFSADSGKEAVESVLTANGESARSFREFALGLNPALSIAATGGKWIPYYGYGAGVVRLSLGDNTELGGKVGGGFVRWNFFKDATVRVGEDLWVEKGKLMK